MKMKFFSLLFMLFASLSAWSQKTVTGKVTNEKGEPLAGATVTVKGGKTASRTKPDGTFNIVVPSNASILVVTFVGTTTQEIAVGNQTNLDLTMREEAATLSDVVVIGYQTVRRKDLLASVSSVSAKDLKDIPINNAAEALNGRLAGVTATTAEGSPDVCQQHQQCGQLILQECISRQVVLLMTRHFGQTHSTCLHLPLRLQVQLE